MTFHLEHCSFHLENLNLTLFYTIHAYTSHVQFFLWFFFNTWNKFITLTLLFLSPRSVICARFCVAAVDWFFSSLRVTCSCFFAWSLLLNPEHGRFYLLACWLLLYVCIFSSCSGTWLSELGTVCSFQVFLLSFVRQDQNNT